MDDRTGPDPDLHAGPVGGTSEGVGPISVFLVDDHEIVRRGLADLLEGDGTLRVIGDAGTVAEALARFPSSLPDVAVLDLQLPDGNGVELCRELRSLYPAVRVLILTGYADDEALLEAVLAGAHGYVLKQIRSNEILEAIHTVARGVSLLSPEVTVRALDRAQRASDELGDLTPQEKRIFELIGEGLSNRQIAERMYLAEKTVKNYVSNLLAKLGMSRRTEAAALAARLDERSLRDPLARR